MRLLIVRHGLAAEREDWAPRPDAERPLTRQGERRMRRGARGLWRLLPEVSVVLTSPFRRALQTAEIVAAEYDVSLRLVPELAADRDPQEALPVLRSLAANDTVALVGHEPGLSELVSLLLGGTARSFVSLRKGGACLLELVDPAPGGGTLLWLLTPRQLRALARH